MGPDPGALRPLRLASQLANSWDIASELARACSFSSPRWHTLTVAGAGVSLKSVRYEAQTGEALAVGLRARAGTGLSSRPSLRCRRLTKSTLLLIPLFGVHYMVFAVFPIGISSKYQILFELCIGSFQVHLGRDRALPPAWRVASDDPFSFSGPGGGGSLLFSQQ